MKKLLWISTALLAAACGDNMNTPDAGPNDARPDGPPIDMPEEWEQPDAHSFQLSAERADVIMTATAGPNGGFYAAGWVDTDIGAGVIERRIVVVKLGANGMPDASFGTNGVKDTGFVFVGGNDEIDIATLSDGSIIVSATVAAGTVNALDAGDRDVGLIKLAAADGAVVDGWGTNGILRHSFNTSLTSANRDQARGIAVKDGAIYISGGGRGPGNIQPGNTLPRTDLDWYVAKLTTAGAGALDTTWSTDGDDGQINVDLFIPPLGETDPAHAGATARGLVVLSDGSVISGGYVSNTLTESPQAVLFKLDETGELDPDFADEGVFHSVVWGGQTEVYNFALHGTQVVTGGYGREGATGPNDYVSMRFDVATGARDMTWGGDPQGKLLVDVNPGTTDPSNCRSAIALPAGKTLLIGSGGPGPAGQGQPPMPGQDAYFVVVDEDGELDTAYGTGIAKYALATNDGADQFWGAAVNGNNVLIVGWRGATVSPQTAANNDDAYGVILPLE